MEYLVPGTGTVVDIIANNKKKEERRRRKAGFFLLYLGSNSTVLIFMILDVYGNLSPYEIAPAFCTNFFFLTFPNHFILLIQLPVQSFGLRELCGETMSVPPSKRQCRRAPASFTPSPVAEIDVAVVPSGCSTVFVIIAELKEQKRVHEQISPLRNTIMQKVKRCFQDFHSGKELSDFPAIISQAKVLFNLVPDPKEQRRGRVQDVFSNVTSLVALRWFLREGVLCSPHDIQKESGLILSDSEYLLGTIAMARELERYSVGRATVGDARSIVLCKRLVSSLLGELMGFDFRNGTLRRHYDGVKYIKKRLEDLLYELSLNSKTTDELEAMDKDLVDHHALNEENFREMQTRMSQYDAKREEVIKSSRDIQKLSKQSVYGLHRGGKAMAGALSNLEKAKDQAIALGEVLEGEPSLRAGSYANALEEWVEGRIYGEWLKDSSTIVSIGDLRKEIHVTADEYLGGLGDFTGEVGRWAVAAATKRDSASVMSALVAIMQVMNILLDISESGDMPGRINKKLGALRKNLTKLEQLRYELALVKGTGRKTLVVSQTAENGSEA